MYLWKVILQKLKDWFSGRTEMRLAPPHIFPLEEVNTVVLVFQYNSELDEYAQAFQRQLESIGKRVVSICRFVGKEKDTPATNSLIWSHKTSIDQFLSTNQEAARLLEKAQLVLVLNEESIPAIDALVVRCKYALVVGYGKNTFNHLHLGSHASLDFTSNWNHLLKTYNYLTHSSKTA